MPWEKAQAPLAAKAVVEAEDMAAAASMRHGVMPAELRMVLRHRQHIWAVEGETAMTKVGTVGER